MCVCIRFPLLSLFFLRLLTHDVFVFTVFRLRRTARLRLLEVSSNDDDDGGANSNNSNKRDNYDDCGGYMERAARYTES